MKNKEEVKLLNKDLENGDLDYSWREAFGYAGEPDTYAGKDNHPNTCIPGDTRVSMDPIAVKDVALIVDASEGDNDGPNWLCVGVTKDNRWFYLSAGCDYTGWD